MGIASVKNTTIANAIYGKDQILWFQRLAESCQANKNEDL